MKKQTRQAQQAKKKRFWTVHLKARERSGLSQNEYCNRNQLSIGQFCYWKKKLLHCPSPALDFVPVSVGSVESQAIPSNTDSGVTILLENSIKIRLTNDFTATTLAKVVSTLGDQS
jgi:hypothetical protein